MAITSDPLEFVPGYISPLTDKEHARIGRIAILWGQIELQTEDLLVLVTKLSWEELEALQITDKPMGQRVSFLTIAGKRLKNPTLEARLKAFIGLINDTKTSRNHVFHGMWSWRANSRKQTVEACARRTKEPTVPMKVAQLIKLEKSLCRCSRLGYDLGWEMRGTTSRTKYTRFIHLAESGAPQWLRQWSERNPLDDVALDRSAKGGKLPRLDALHPPK
jgi:hypothetical protein